MALPCGWPYDDGPRYAATPRSRRNRVRRPRHSDSRISRNFDVPIRERFGDAVIAIVRNCTDGTAETKTQLETPEAKRADWQGDAGIDVSQRFKAGREGTLQHYETLARIFLKRASADGKRFHELAREFNRTVGQMHSLAGVESREPLA